MPAGAWAAWLLGAGGSAEVVFAAHFAATDEELRSAADHAFAGMDPRGRLRLELLDRGPLSRRASLRPDLLSAGTIAGANLASQLVEV